MQATTEWGGACDGQQLSKPSPSRVKFRLSAQSLTSVTVGPSAFPPPLAGGCMIWPRQSSTRTKGNILTLWSHHPFPAFESPRCATPRTTARRPAGFCHCGLGGEARVATPGSSGCMSYVHYITSLYGQWPILTGDACVFLADGSFSDHLRDWAAREQVPDRLSKGDRRCSVALTGC
ncbi:hypothetical protein LX36DRAFT_464638 [Colletotrichum falcatum]|nr:hypothetical protein LX36DRAFT_464638 [Colletotrichum falcatum]